MGQKLPDYMIPSTFILLNELPLTANGKVDRQALPIPDNIKKAKPEKAFTAPRTPVEVLLAAIWRRILEIEQIGITDSFFELGGDSLLATKLSAMVRTELEVELSLGSIFERPTIAELAEHIQALEGQKTEKSGAVACLPQIVPAPDQQYLPFPLTDIQQAYWVGRSGVYALGNVATHCYFEIEGTDLDLERINSAWQRLIDHHGMMRAVILPDGEQQKILEQVSPYQIEVLDFREKCPEAVETELKRLRDEMSHQILSAEKWPLFDLRASRFEEKRVRLHISFDNLIFDGWSMFHLLREWTRLYHEPDAPLPSHELSFRDYVLALERLKESDLYKRDQEYWFNRLPELPTAPELPLAQDPRSLSRQRFDRLDARLSRETWRQLKRRAKDAGLTPSGLLLSAYAEVLGVWSRHPKFTINLTQFNRLPLHPEVNDIVGDFTSLTLLAVDNALGKTFVERGRNLQRQLWLDLDHSYVGGMQVQRELTRRLGDHQDVVMPVVFTSALGVDRQSEADSGAKWIGKLIYNITQTPQVWLDHQVLEQDGELLLIWDFVEGLFPEGLLDDMFGAYSHLLQRLAGEEAAWREATPSLVSVPRLEKRIEANHTDAPVSAETLFSLYAKQAVRQPHHPAVISSRRTLTYGALSERSGRVRELLLRKKGVLPDTMVAVVMEKGWEQVAAVLGILQAGAAYLPIDPANPEERRWHFLRDADIRVVLTQSWIEERLNWPDGVERLSVDQINQRDVEFSPPEFTGKAEDLAYVIYTSGSTGFPKGVMIEHRGAVNTILDVNRLFCVGPEDRILALSNLNFDLSVYDVFGMLAAGATIIMPEDRKAREPSYWLELMKQERVTVWNTVPALMQMLLEYVANRDEVMSQSLRLVLLSGDWIPLNLPDRIKAHFHNARVVGLGGATEASIWSNLYPIREVDSSWKSIPYGRPMANQRYHVFNEFMENCPVWVPGQLYIGGIGLARGYWRDEEKTRAGFIIHPRSGERLYRTGDLGCYLPDGNIEFLGREDFQIKIRGHRIELGEIEATLERLPGVKNAVVGLAGEFHEKNYLVGYVVPDPENESNLFAIEQAEPNGCAERWEAIRSAARRRAAQIPDSVACEEIPIFTDYADQLSTMQMSHVLYNMGIFKDGGECYGIEELMQRFKISPRYRTLLLHWLKALTEDGLLEMVESGRYRNQRPLNEGWPDFAKVAESEFSSELSKAALSLYTSLRRYIASYGGLLKGEIDPLDLLLGDDLFLSPEALSRFDPAREYFIAIAREVFVAIVNSFPNDQQIRVLEIGTRAGRLTEAFAPLLPKGRGRYLYTDESTFFTDRARRKWEQTTSLEYGLFNMNRPPLQQGYDLHAFHVIIADNTLHRARNIDATLAHLKAMLAPGGLLVLTEITRNNRLMLTTTGFFEDGFSHLEDERATPCLPLLSAEKWRAVLKRSGFERVMLSPEGEQAADVFEQHLLVAQVPEMVKVFKPAILADAMRRKLPDYMVPEAYVLLDELPLSVNGKVDRKAIEKIGNENRKTPKKNHVAPVTETQMKIASVWEKVLGCMNVGINDSFFELGGDSLRAVQCINLLKERGQADLSLQDLFKAPTIALLAHLFESKYRVKAEPLEDYEQGTI